MTWVSTRAGPFWARIVLVPPPAGATGATLKVSAVAGPGARHVERGAGRGEHVEVVEGDAAGAGDDGQAALADRVGGGADRERAGVDCWMAPPGVASKMTLLIDIPAPAVSPLTELPEKPVTVIAPPPRDDDGARRWSRMLVLVLNARLSVPAAG